MSRENEHSAQYNNGERKHVLKRVHLLFTHVAVKLSTSSEQSHGQMGVVLQMEHGKGLFKCRNRQLRPLHIITFWSS